MLYPVYVVCSIDLGEFGTHDYIYEDYEAEIDDEAIADYYLENLMDDDVVQEYLESMGEEAALELVAKVFNLG